MTIVDKGNYSGRDLSGKSLGKREFRGCNFTSADARKLHFEDATLLDCNMEHMKLIGATFRLTCKQGVGNTLDNDNVLLFMYWFKTMFKLSDEMNDHIKAMIGNKEAYIKTLFERQPQLI